MSTFSTDISEVLDDKFNDVFNTEHTYDNYSNHNLVSSADLINLALKADREDTSHEQLDSPPPVDFDAPGTNMLNNHFDSASERRPGDMPTTMEEEPFDLGTDSTRGGRGIHRITKSISHAACGVVTADVVDKQCTPHGFTGFADCRAFNTDALHLNTVQNLNGFESPPCVYVASDSTSCSAQLVPQPRRQNTLYAQNAQLSPFEPSHPSLVASEAHRISPKSIPQASSAAMCSALSTSSTPTMTTAIPSSRFPINHTSVTPFELTDKERCLPSEDITALTKVIRKPKTWQNSSKNRYSKGATLSRYCHICGRNSRIELGQCSNFKLGLCRKVVCEKCLILYEPDSRLHALDPDSDWQCTHCREECPGRARCKQYTQNNQKRRDKSAREKEERQRASQTRATNMACQAAMSPAYADITDTGPSHSVE